MEAVLCAYEIWFLHSGLNVFCLLFSEEAVVFALS